MDKAQAEDVLGLTGRRYTAQDVEAAHAQKVQALRDRSAGESSASDGPLAQDPRRVLESARLRLVAEAEEDVPHASRQPSRRRLAWKAIAGETLLLIAGGIAAWMIHSRTPRPAGTVRRVDLGGGVWMEMNWVPPATFVMGSPLDEERRQPDERQHPVTLSQGYWMGTYEVTQGQWHAVMGTTMREHHDQVGATKGLHGEGADLPMYYVRWEDAQAFVKALNERCKGGRFRLPTEAEWEHACRAQTTSAWAGEPERMAWYLANSEGRVRPVGQKQPNPWGIHDLQGNLWEWCQDGYGAYPESAVTDPTGPASFTYRVLRGGSCANYVWNCRSAQRFQGVPSYPSYLVGFRLVKED